MKVEILKEAGYKEAMIGLGLSYNVGAERAMDVAPKLACKDGGHNKFLESISVWLNIVAPRYWWQEFDTYRVGVTKQSESTMHTITKRPLKHADFEFPICEHTLQLLNSFIANKNFMAVKIELPESFLQRRIVCTNYKALRNMIEQRKNHKLQEWHIFIEELKNLSNYKLITE